MRGRAYSMVPLARGRSRERVVLSLLSLLSIAFLQCREKTAAPPMGTATSANASTPADSAASAATKSPQASRLRAIPRFQAVLRGHGVDDQGTDSVTLELASDYGGIGGSFRIGNADALHFTAAQAVPLAFDSSAAAITADFRLRYALDLCEHVAPTPTGEPFQWGQCFHYQGAQKPSALQWNQALVRVQRMPAAATTRITAAGLPDSASLSSVYRVTGTIKP
jgi:hypothetical protein